MKSFIALILCAFLYTELCYGLSHKSITFRIRREADQAEALDAKHLELQRYVNDALVQIYKIHLNAYVKTLGKIVDQAEKTETKTKAFKENIGQFKKVLDTAMKLFEDDFDKNKSVEKLFQLSSDADDLIEIFKKPENPTDEESLFRGFIIENDADTLSFQLITDLVFLRNEIHKRIGEYIEELTEAEKHNQKDFIDWYDSLKTSTADENSIQAMTGLFKFGKKNPGHKTK